MDLKPYNVPVVKTEPGLSGDEEAGSKTLLSAANIKKEEIYFPQLPVEFEMKIDAEAGSQYMGFENVYDKVEKDLAISHLPVMKPAPENADERVNERKYNTVSGTDVDIMLPDVKQECFMKAEQRSQYSCFETVYVKMKNNLAIIDLPAVKPEPGSAFKSEAESEGGVTAVINVSLPDVKQGYDDISKMVDQKTGITVLRDRAYLTLPRTRPGKESLIVTTPQRHVSKKLLKLSCKRDGNLVKHIVLTHSSLKPFVCPRCPYTCSSKGNLNKHILTHSTVKPFQCSECSYTCKRNGNLSTHILTHSVERPFSCSQCSYTCNHKRSIRNHMLLHTGGTPSPCSQSWYTSNYKGSIRTHTLALSGQKVFSCSQCSYTCNHKKILKIHVLTHSENKPFSCSQCSYTCTHRSSIRNHKLIHTGETPFSCAQCPYTCKRKCSLSRHILIHSEDKLFSCLQCTYTCNRKISLTIHMVSHTGEKPFACSQCSYTCNRKLNLKNHILTHSGEKPFSCVKCDYKSFTNRSLTLHMKKHPESS